MKRELTYTRELRDLWRLWSEKWPDTITFQRNQTKGEAWWDRASMTCLSKQITPALMLYIVYAYSNANPEEAEIPFGPTSFRSESIMRRSIANFRDVLLSAQKQLELVYLIKTGECRKAPASTTQLVRDVAEDAIDFFKVALEIKLHPLGKLYGGIERIPPQLHDTTAYVAAAGNPFLLLSVAKTDRFRAMAGVNSMFMCYDQPWNHDVWEGLVTPMSLRTPQVLVNHRLEDYYENGQLCRAIPEALDSNGRFVKLISDNPPPAIWLLETWFSREAELYLRAKLDSYRPQGPR